MTSSQSASGHWQSLNQGLSTTKRPRVKRASSRTRTDTRGSLGYIFSQGVPIPARRKLITPGPFSPMAKTEERELRSSADALG